MAKDKPVDIREYFAVMLMGLFFVIIIGLALLFTYIFNKANINMEAFENPNDPLNIVYILVIMFVFTIAILVIAKYWKAKVIKFLILGAIGYTTFFLIYPLLGLIIPEVLSLVLSIILSIALVWILVKYPEWYVIDLCGVIVGAGAIAIFGISLGVWLVLILLIILAIYDAISVYKTKHMIDLADTVMDLKLPVLLVVPKIRHYSLIKETKRLKEKLKEGEERDAFFMGLGDIVMPGILVVAAYFNSNNISNGLALAFSVLIGTLVGFAILMTFVMKGKPQAGLPCLCGGAIIAYLIASYLLFGKLIGINLHF